MARVGQADTDSFVHRSWTMADGLPQNSIFAIEQSEDGYLWIGTLQGLVRFDGRRFTLFSAATTPGLNGDRIVGLAKGVDGALWIGTQANGVSRYLHGKFETFTINDGLPSNAMGPTGVIHVAASGNVWITTDRGLVKYIPDPGTGRGHFVKLSKTSGLPTDVLTSVFEDPDGSLWVGTGEGLAYRAANSNSWQVYSADFELPDDRIGVIKRARDGTFWFGTTRGVVHFNSVTRQSTRYLLESTLVFSVIEDRNGVIWAGSAGHGLLRFDGTQFLPAQHTADIGPAVVQIFEDREGLIWVGTNGNGIHSLRRGSFSTYAAAARGNPGPMTHAVLETLDGDIWIATYSQGLFRITQDKHQRTYTTADGLPSQTIWSLAETRDGTLWVGTENGLVRYLKEHDRFELIDIPTLPYISTERISSLTLDKAGRLLVGTYFTKLVRLNWHQEKIVDASVLLEAKEVPRGGAILSILQASDDTIWVGTEAAGVVQLKANLVTFYAEQQGLKRVSIRTLVEREDGSIWVGTYGSGICNLTPGSQHFLCLTSENGLPDNTIHSIVEDDFGFLWTSSNKGLFRLRFEEVNDFFKGETSSINADVYTPVDGLPATEFNGNFQPNSWRMQNGRLLFPSTNGVAVVDPNNMASIVSANLPTMHVENFVADGVRVNDVVPAGSKRLVIAFTGINFTTPDALHFRYRLDGEEPEGVWNQTADDRFATYTNIAPGIYTFRAQGALGSGEWEETSFTFKVAPLFHQTWWFVLLSVVVGVSIVIGTIWQVSRQRIQRELGRIEAQRLLEAERTRISRDMHDEVGASLTEIAMLSELAQRELKVELPPTDLEQPNRLMRIADISRSSLDSIGEIIWALNPRNDLLPVLSGYIREYTARFLEPTDIQVCLIFPEYPPDLFVGAELRRNIFLITKEALHNIVKHANATTVEVHLAIEANFLSLTITDNGIGFHNPAAQKDTPASVSPGGNGLRNIRRRAEEIDAMLTISPVPGKGTIVSIEVIIP